VARGRAAALFSDAEEVRRLNAAAALLVLPGGWEWAVFGERPSVEHLTAVT